MDYVAYMRSDAWATRRAVYFKNHRRRCRCCGTDKRVQLHHLSYERVDGSERDADLMALCQRCHSLVHRVAGLRPDLSLAEATRSTVAELQARRSVERREKPEFVPRRRRILSGDLAAEPGDELHGRLGGLPIRVVPPDSVYLSRR